MRADLRIVHEIVVCPDTQHEFLDASLMHIHPGTDSFQCDVRGVSRVHPVGSHGNAGERHRFALLSEQLLVAEHLIETRKVRLPQQHARLRLAMQVSVRTYGVNDVLASCLTFQAAKRRRGAARPMSTSFREVRYAKLLQLRPCCFMDGTVDAASAQKRRSRRIHNHVHVERGNVAFPQKQLPVQCDGFGKGLSLQLAQVTSIIRSIQLLCGRRFPLVVLNCLCDEWRRGTVPRLRAPILRSKDAHESQVFTESSACKTPEVNGLQNHAGQHCYSSSDCMLR